jgi:hypothetical protein
LHKSEKGEAFAKENPDFISNAAAQMLTLASSLPLR